MTDTAELRTEGKIAADKNMRIGFYCLEAADEIERLRADNKKLLEILGEAPCETNGTDIETCLKNGDCCCAIEELKARADTSG